MTWFLSYVTNQGQINIHLFLSSFFFPADIWKLTLDECLTFTTFNICILHTIISKAKPTFHRFVCLLKGQFDRKNYLGNQNCYLLHTKCLKIRQNHDVWKSQKKPHSTLRAKRATFTFWVWAKVNWKVAKMVNFGEFLKTWS